jgi:hypothetical protein
MQRANPKAQQRGKSGVLVAGLGAAFVAAGLTFALMSGSSTAPSSPSVETTAPVQTAMQVQPAPAQAPAPVQLAPPVQTAPPPQAPPIAQAPPPQDKSCTRSPLVEYAYVENGGSGVVRFREGDYVSPWITLSSQQQSIPFPTLRRDTYFKESIIIEGQGTNLVLGADGDHFQVPRVDGTYSYTMEWAPMKCPGQ